MIKDAIVKEIRAYRAEHAARYGNDLEKICEALRQQEKKSKKEFVDFGPKLLNSKKEDDNKSSKPIRKPMRAS